MELFATLVTSFPTVIYSFFVLLFLAYWLIAMLGFLDIDMFDADFDADADMDGADGIGGLAGVLIKLGLDGVPVTVSLSILFLICWLISYFMALTTGIVLPLDVTLIRYAVGLVIMVAAFLLAIPITGFLIKPLKTFFKKTNTNSERSLLGASGVVRTSRVSMSFGEAIVNAGGADLILRIRADEALGLTRHDAIVLIEYIDAENAYRVVTEKEFHGHGY